MSLFFFEILNSIVYAIKYLFFISILRVKYNFAKSDIHNSIYYIQDFIATPR